ncbi:hypothetical protein CR513_28290, partial [Mucuna pruriens]
MLNYFNSFKFFWAKTINTTCYLQNRIYIRPILRKTSYELLKVRLEVIHILLSFATYYNMILHKMDVRCAFLNGIINKDIYVKQPPSFESDAFPNHTSRKNYNSHFVIVQIYVDYTDETLFEEFSELM